MTTNATTWNPNDVSPQLTLSNDNLTVTYSATYSTQAGVFATAPAPTTGTYTVVFTANTVPSGATISWGLASVGHPINESLGGSDSAGVSQSGAISYNGFSSGGNIGAVSAGDTITITYSNGSVWFKRNSGYWNGSSTANPATGVGGLSLSYIPVPLYPIVYTQTESMETTADFSQWQPIAPAFTIDVADFGAMGNAVGGGDGTVTGTNTLSTPTYTFTSADVGLSLWVDTTQRTIASVSGGDATFTPSGATNGTSVTWLIGTDDTQAIANALNYATSVSGYVGTTSSGFENGGVVQGATVQLRSGYGYLVSNSEAAWNEGTGTPGCIVVPRRVGLRGSGQGFYTTAIHVAPNSYGHVICNETPGTSVIADFITISNLTVFCNSNWSSGQLDGVHLEISTSGNYQKVDAYNRVSWVQVFLAYRYGFYFSGRGESYFHDISTTQAGSYGMYFNVCQDMLIERANSGGSQLTGMRVNIAPNCRFIGCKSYYNGASGGSDILDTANWAITADQQINGLSSFIGCEAQQSQGSAWVIQSGLNLFDGCVANDPGNGIGSGTPSPIAGFHLSGNNASNNTFVGCRVQPSGSIFDSPNNWGNAGNAVQIDGAQTGQNAASGPQHNAGSIYTFQSTTNPDGSTAVGITYPSGSGPVGGAGASNAHNTTLFINGVACT